MIKHKACAKPGCPATHTGPGSFCDEHRPKRDDDFRPNATDRGYTYEWKQERKRYLRRHPFCECQECRTSGKPFKADVVDHIKPHRGDMFLFWDKSNWRAMAKRCHDQKTVRHDGGFGT